MGTVGGLSHSNKLIIWVKTKIPWTCAFLYFTSPYIILTRISIFHCSLSLLDVNFQLWWGLMLFSLPQTLHVCENIPTACQGVSRVHLQWASVCHWGDEPRDQAYIRWEQECYGEAKERYILLVTHTHQVGGWGWGFVPAAPPSLFTFGEGRPDTICSV